MKVEISCELCKVKNHKGLLICKQESTDKMMRNHWLMVVSSVYIKLRRVSKTECGEKPENARECGNNYSGQGHKALLL